VLSVPFRARPNLGLVDHQRELLSSSYLLSKEASFSAKQLLLLQSHPRHSLYILCVVRVACSPEAWRLASSSYLAAIRSVPVVEGTFKADRFLATRERVVSRPVRVGDVVTARSLVRRLRMSLWTRQYCGPGRGRHMPVSSTGSRAREAPVSPVVLVT